MMDSTGDAVKKTGMRYKSDKNGRAPDKLLNMNRESRYRLFLLDGRLVILLDERENIAHERIKGALVRDDDPNKPN